MFKALFNFLDVYDPAKETFNAYVERTGDKDLEVFVEGMQNFPFYELVQKRIKGQSSSQG